MCSYMLCVYTHRESIKSILAYRVVWSLCTLCAYLEISLGSLNRQERYQRRRFWPHKLTKHIVSKIKHTVFFFLEKYRIRKAKQT